MRPRGCSITDITAGCAGILLGAGLTVAAELYVVFKVTQQVTELSERGRAEGPSQKTYDRLCSSGAWKHDIVLKQMCERMKRELDAKASGSPVPSGKHGAGTRRPHGQ